MRGIPIPLAWDEPAQVFTPNPAALGPAFAAFVDHLAGWDQDTIDRCRRAAEPLYTETFCEVDRRLTDAFDAAQVGADPCTFGVEDGGRGYAGPYFRAIAYTYGASATLVAEAVLGRDLGLITETDFDALTGWWVVAGFPLPAARDGAQFAAGQAEVDQRAKHLSNTEYQIKNWPLAAVA